MTASWDSFGPARRQRRIRGAEIITPHPVPWREQRQAVERAQKEAQARMKAAADPDSVPAPGIRFGALRIDPDGVFAFALIVPMLFAANLGTLSAAAIAGLAPLYLYVRRKQLLRVMLPRFFLLAVPAFTVLSVVWSEAPKETLKYSLEFGITVLVGLLLCTARNQEAVLRGLTAAFLIYVINAIVVGERVDVGVGAGGTAFSGLTNSKNLLADIASTGLLISMATAFLAMKSRNLLWLGVCALAIAIDLYLVFAARSAGAVIALAIGLFPLLVLSPLVSAGKAVRGWLTASVTLLLVAAAVSHRWLASMMLELSTRMFDKDPTLTGRTYLWYRGAELIREKPELGRGYNAFWLQGNVDAEGLWQFGGITNRSGFTFHNTLVEILVTLGYVGAALIIVAAIVGMLALVVRFVAKPTLALVFWMSLLMYELTRTPIETVGILPFYFSTVLIFAALGAGFGRVRPARPAAAYRAARTVQVQPVDYTRKGTPMRPDRNNLRLLTNPNRVDR
jgi:exopolysaccharide production protein ExoQ